jgi:hypothetical protein
MAEIAEVKFEPNVTSVEDYISRLQSAPAVVPVVFAPAGTAAPFGTGASALPPAPGTSLTNAPGGGVAALSQQITSQAIAGGTFGGSGFIYPGLPESPDESAGPDDPRGNRGGGGGWGRRLGGYYLAHRAYAAANRYGRGYIAYQQAGFAESEADTAAGYYRAGERRISAIESIPGGAGTGAVLDLLGSDLGPTHQRNVLESAAHAADTLTRIRGMGLDTSDERLRRAAYGAGGPEGREQAQRAEILISGTRRQAELAYERQELEAVNREIVKSGQEITPEIQSVMSDRRIRIGALRDRESALGSEIKFNLQQFDDRRREGLSLERMGMNTEVRSSRFRTGRDPLAAQLNDIYGEANVAAAREPDLAGDYNRRAGQQALETAAAFSRQATQHYTARQFQNAATAALLAHDPLGSQLQQVQGAYEAEVAAMPSGGLSGLLYAPSRLQAWIGLQRQRALVTQQFGEAQTATNFGIASHIQSLATINSGQGLYADRVRDAGLNDIVSGALGAADTQRRAGNLAGFQLQLELGRQQVEAQRQATLNSLQPVTVSSLSRIAVSDPRALMAAFDTAAGKLNGSGGDAITPQNLETILNRVIDSTLRKMDQAT